jgi:PAS domain-containing protein
MTVDVDAGEKAEDESGYVAQLQATLNVIPAHTWYASPSGGLTFVNKRTADYLGLPEDHPLRFGIGFNVPAHPGRWPAGSRMR